jgi:hypothetical protein
MEGFESVVLDLPATADLFDDELGVRQDRHGNPARIACFPFGLAEDRLQTVDQREVLGFVVRGLARVLEPNRLTGCEQTAGDEAAESLSGIAE